MINLIGISGRKQAGKDTFYNVFNSMYPAYKNKKFAYALKNMCATLTGTPFDWFNDAKYYDIIIKGWDKTPRQIMQIVGTDCFRKHFDEDVWVKALFAHHYKNSQWVITDVRFPNEANAIKERGGILIRVNRTNSPQSVDNHLSETSLDDYEHFDHVIENSGTLEEYHSKCIDLINSLD